MLTNWFLTILVFIMMLMFLASVATADYALEAGAFTTAGGQVYSLNYGLFSSFGQSQPIEVPVGDAKSDNLQLFAGFLSVATSGKNYGDVSGDGRVTAYDAGLVLQYVVGLRTFTPEQISLADVSGKNGVTAYDAGLILKYVVGLITRFPVQGDL